MLRIPLASAALMATVALGTAIAVHTAATAPAAPPASTVTAQGERSAPMVTTELDDMYWD
jgi:hypothetical protein